VFSRLLWFSPNHMQRLAEKRNQSLLVLPELYLLISRSGFQSAAYNIVMVILSNNYGQNVFIFTNHSTIIILSV
jgi:hypothetical protein